jgi:hypothetical protein
LVEHDPPGQVPRRVFCDHAETLRCRAAGALRSRSAPCNRRFLSGSIAAAAIVGDVTVLDEPAARSRCWSSQIIHSRICTVTLCHHLSRRNGQHRRIRDLTGRRLCGVRRRTALRHCRSQIVGRKRANDPQVDVRNLTRPLESLPTIRGGQVQRDRSAILLSARPRSTNPRTTDQRYLPDTSALRLSPCSRLAMS